MVWSPFEHISLCALFFSRFGNALSSSASSFLLLPRLQDNERKRDPEPSLCNPLLLHSPSTTFFSSSSSSYRFFPLYLLRRPRNFLFRHTTEITSSFQFYGNNFLVIFYWYHTNYKKKKHFSLEVNFKLAFENKINVFDFKKGNKLADDEVNKLTRYLYSLQ